MTHITIERADLENWAKALKIAHDQLVNPVYAPIGWSASRLAENFSAMQKALAQPVQEPVAWPVGSAEYQRGLLAMGKALAKERSREIGDAWNQLANLLTVLEKARSATQPAQPAPPVQDRVRGLECVIADLQAECKALRAAQVQPVQDASLIDEGKTAAPVQEPIAWIERDMMCDDFDPDSVTCKKPEIAAEGWEWVGLVIATTPPAQPAPVQELEEQLADALDSLNFYRRRVEALQQWQSKMRDPERIIVCDILANGHTLEPAGDRYATPPAQPKQEPVQDPVAITDQMAFAFHNAITYGAIGTDDLMEIMRGLEAAFAHITTPPAQRKPLTDEQRQDLMNKAWHKWLIETHRANGVPAHIQIKC